MSEKNTAIKWKECFKDIWIPADEAANLLVDEIWSLRQGHWYLTYLHMAEKWCESLGLEVMAKRYSLRKKPLPQRFQSNENALEEKLRWVIIVSIQTHNYFYISRL